MTFGSFQDPVSLALSPQFLLQRWGPLNWAGWLGNRESKLPLTESRHPELLGELIPILKLISEKFFFFRRTSATNFCMFALCLLVRLPILPNDATPHRSCQVVNVALSWAVCQGFHGSYLWFFFNGAGLRKFPRIVIKYIGVQTGRYAVHTFQEMVLISFHRISCRQLLPIHFKYFISHCSSSYFHFDFCQFNHFYFHIFSYFLIV